MIRQFTAASAALLLTFSVASVATHAQSGSSADASRVFDKKHLLSVGMTRQETSTSVSATSENFNPITVDLDGLALGERDYSYFIDYHYRLKPRWSIFAGTFQYSDSGRSITEREFNFDGVEFTTGSEIRSEVNIDVYMLDLLYTVHRSNNVEVMLGGGLHAFDLGVGFAGNVSINDQSSEFRTANSSLLAPVPNLRGAATWTLNERFGFSLIAGWLSANVDEYSGDFMYAHLRANYQFGDRFGAALGYQFTDIDITQDRSRSELSFDAELEGPSFTVTYSF